MSLRTAVDTVDTSATIKHRRFECEHRVDLGYIGNSGGAEGGTNEIGHLA